MADYLQILRGITGGLEAGQNFRANRQIERGREQALESGEYDLQGRRIERANKLPKIYGESRDLPDYQATLGDPFAFKLLDWFKAKRAARKSRSAVPAAAPQDYGPPSDLQNSYAPTSDDFGAQYADGGSVARQDDLTDEELAAERLYIAQQQAESGARQREGSRRAALQTEMARNGGIGDEALAARQAREADTGTVVRGASGAEGAVNEFLSPVMGPNVIPQQGAGRSTSGPPGPRVQAGGRPRAALALGDESAAAPAQAPPSVAAARGNAQPGAAAPRRAAVPTQDQEQRVDFSQLDAEPKDVPNMTTDDWKRYRLGVLEAARATGRPGAVQQANQLVTEMQQQGFLAYGQQGLALQQAGNLKGAMAAYRAAFQYFPNGNDVEFGLIKDRQGQQQIVGYGRDEKTNKIVEGSQIVMNPEQAARLLENFTKPEAFRAWTKDWRDFEEGQRRFNAGVKDKQGDDAFRNKRYNEVEKPLAQAQADSLANRSEADILRASKTGTPALRPSELQRSEAAFRERLELVGLTDEAKKDQLASIMSQIKASNPSTPDNVIINAVVAAERDGTLAKRLQQMGIQ